MPPKTQPLRHPIRDGFGFIAAAATAVVQLFTPASRRTPPPAVEAAEPDPDCESLEKRIVPYPVED